MQIFNAYWSGHLDTTIKLKNIPEYIDFITLSFASPENNAVNIEYLCSQYDESLLISEIKLLQENGKRVLLSIVDNPDNQWDKIDIKEFTKNLNEKILFWGLNGIDIVAESSMNNDVYSSKFIELINTISNICGNEIYITYSCNYDNKKLDADVLSNISSDIDWVNILSFKDPSSPIEEMYNYYYIFVKDRICICIKADEDSISIEQLELISKSYPNKMGMALWTINRDTNIFTQKEDLIYADTIHKSILDSNKPFNKMNNLVSKFTTRLIYSIDNIILNTMLKIDDFIKYIKIY